MSYPTRAEGLVNSTKQPGTKEAKQFWSKIWEQKEHNKMDNRINNMKKQSQEYEEVPVAEIHLGSPRITQKKNTKLENTGP